MKFSINEKQFAITAFDYAIEWEQELIRCHKNCNSNDDDELRKKCAQNIEAFKKLRKKFERVR